MFDPNGPDLELIVVGALTTGPRTVKTIAGFVEGVTVKDVQRAVDHLLNEQRAVVLRDGQIALIVR